MKKTLIITILMLAVFAAAVAAAADKIESGWEKQSVDSADFQDSSPVKQVEESLKTIDDYKFITYEDMEKRGITEGEKIIYSVNSAEWHDGMVSHKEAAYIGGSALEKVTGEKNISQKEFILNLEKTKLNVQSEKDVYFHGYYEEKYQNVNEERIMLSYSYWIDPYSKEVIYIRNFFADTGVNIKMTQQEAVDYAVKLAESFGYSGLKKYLYTTVPYGTDGELYGVELLLDDEKSIGVCINSYRDSFLYMVSDSSSINYKEVTENGVEF